MNYSLIGGAQSVTKKKSRKIKPNRSE